MIAAVVVVIFVVVVAKVDANCILSVGRPLCGRKEADPTELKSSSIVFTCTDEVGRNVFVGIGVRPAASIPGVIIPGLW